MERWRPLVFAHLSAIWQYRWQGLATAWVVCVLGWLGVTTIPNTYRSAAEVYIDTNTLLRPLLSGLAVTTDPNQQIQIMLRMLLTEPTLERVLRATDPKAASWSSKQMQNAVAHLRKNISLTNLQAHDLYRIAYRDRNPAHAQSVTQTLVSVLIDTSLGGQRRDADHVGTFLKDQISNYEHQLIAADKRRAEFKSAHLEFFSAGPNGVTVGGAGDVVAAQAAFTQAQNTLSEAIDRRNSLRAQLKSTPKTLDVNSPVPAIMNHSGTAIGNRTQLAAAIAKLNMLRTQYTDNYPDVVAQKRLIARLKSAPFGEVAGKKGISNPGYVMIMSKLADTESEVAVDRNRLQDAKKRLANAKKLATRAITVERQYENLDRDYQVLHGNYEALVARRESAKLTQAASDQQSSFVFRVISPPLKPHDPVAPNRLRLNAAVLLLGLGAGVGLAFALGQFFGRFQTIEQLKEAFELPVLGAVTTVRTGPDMSAAVRSTAVFAAGLGLLVLSGLIAVYMFHSGGVA